MQTRRHDLDWVRVLAFGLLVVYHVGMYYVTWDWLVKSPLAGPTLEPLMMLTSPWRLSLLFMVSGAATAFLLAKASASNAASGFLGQRSWRLLIPLVFGMLVIVPPQSYYEVVENLPGGYTEGYLAFWGRYLQGDDSFCHDDECLSLPTWNHLWFVAYLWVYTVALWLMLRLAPTIFGRMEARVRMVLSGSGLLLWPALYLVAARVMLVGVFETTHGLVDDWYNHTQYLPIFLLGYCIARADAIWERIQRLRWPALLIALCSYGFLAWYFSHFSDTLEPPTAVRMVQRGVWGLNQWTSIVAILGFAHRFAPADSRALRYLSAAIFPVYILHQTVIVVAAHNLKPLALPIWLEGPLLIALTFGVCFAAYEVIRRSGPLRPLFGLKKEASARVQPVLIQKHAEP